MKLKDKKPIREGLDLSVSSYGSCGVKPNVSAIPGVLPHPFSILLRIVRGETLPAQFQRASASLSFSILLRIVRGETGEGSISPLL